MEDDKVAKATEVENSPDWKDHAREWERRAKENLEQLNAAKAENETLRNSGTEWEQKLADTKTRADEEKALATAALREQYVNKLALARLEATAAAKGVTLPEAFAEVVNISKFVDAEAGDVNTEMVASFVESLATQTPKFDQSFSSGPQSAGTPAVDYSPKAIAERVSKSSPY